jgi:hypothetical protein
MEAGTVKLLGETSIGTTPSKLKLDETTAEFNAAREAAERQNNLATVKMLAALKPKDELYDAIIKTKNLIRN